jgi:hypothetical protein
MSIARSAILVMTVQQWSVIFINQQARETATGSESAREGKPTFDHQRHPQKNERCAGVIPRVFAITVQQWPVIFIKHQPRETAQRTTQQTRRGVCLYSNGAILQTATPMHFLNVAIS